MTAVTSSAPMVAPIASLWPRRPLVRLRCLPEESYDSHPPKLLVRLLPPKRVETHGGTGLDRPRTGLFPAQEEN
jgi:hypothetical protein